MARLIYLLILVVLPTAGPLSARAGYDDWTQLGRELMPLEQAEQRKWFNEAGLLEVSPVILPEGEHLVGHNIHFGWP
ncbi:hypothetical protein SB781_35660, partial [Paraburkholderia sp. SIMBA_061]